MNVEGVERRPPAQHTRAIWVALNGRGVPPFPPMGDEYRFCYEKQLRRNGRPGETNLAAISVARQYLEGVRATALSVGGFILWVGGFLRNRCCAVRVCVDPIWRVFA